MKDKWRNLIKFQHLRVDEAAKVPYKAAVKAANAANAKTRLRRPRRACGSPTGRRLSSPVYTP